MDWRKIRESRDPLERANVIREVAEQSLSDGTFSHAECFLRYEEGGRDLLLAAQSIAERNPAAHSFKFRVIGDGGRLELSRRGFFALRLGYPEQIHNPNTGRARQFTTRDANRMHRIFQRTKNLDDHPEVFEFFALDSDGCFECGFDRATLLAQNYTDGFFIDNEAFSPLLEQVVRNKARGGKK